MEAQLINFSNQSLLAAGQQTSVSSKAATSVIEEVKSAEKAVETLRSNEAISKKEVEELDSQNALREQQTLLKAEAGINEALLSSLNQKIGFDKDENTGKTIIVIKNKETDEVIRQIPPQHFLDLVYNLNKAASIVLKDIPKYA